MYISVFFASACLTSSQSNVFFTFTECSIIPSSYMSSVFLFAKFGVSFLSEAGSEAWELFYDFKPQLIVFDFVTM